MLGAAALVSTELRDRLRFTGGIALAAATVRTDEASVPAYELPPLLQHADGSAVTGPADWQERRRPELLRLFRERIYGEAPVPPAPVTATLREASQGALGGRAQRLQFGVHVLGDPAGPTLELLVYLPAGATAPVPVFLGLNFLGNASVHPDPAILLSDAWMPPFPEEGIRDHRQTEAVRGQRAHRWPVETLLARGYGVATAYAGDLVPDHPRGLAEGLPAALPGSWGAISVWAFGLSRALDALTLVPGVDARRVAVIGHSRLGKAALWAGAQDERFALVVSNDSGCMGAALSRRRFGETVRVMNHLFPHWMPDAFSRFGGNEDALPIDQHALLGLVAPRPLAVGSASEDDWADPRGEFLALREASAVWELLGQDGLPPGDMPPAGETLVGGVAYHLRPGEHDVLAADWERYLDFADRVMPALTPARSEP